MQLLAEQLRIPQEARGVLVSGGRDNVWLLIAERHRVSERQVGGTSLNRGSAGLGGRGVQPDGAGNEQRDRAESRNPSQPWDRKHLPSLPHPWIESDHNHGGW